MATFLVAHGAWSAGWVWKKMRPLLRERGHELFTPTYTGLGERVHLANPEIGLSTHISDVVSVLEFEDLHDVTLIGHSYGGMVATGVADRVPQRLAQIVYLDAFVPLDGQSLNSLRPSPLPAGMGNVAHVDADEWRIPPNPLPPDTSPEDADWIMPRRVMQPRQTFEEPVRITGAVYRLPRAYVYCTRVAPGDVFRQFAERARSEPGWRYFELDASHSPHVTAPLALARLLDRIVARGSST
ncbi:MAG: alpha/beta hydrolase [Burkholderiaceae bacterium]|nr:alpha/beta hydrolase [Burkholderiaceae bacterium]